MMRDMSRELGEDMGPEFDEVVDRLEKGQSPEEIERDLPDLGADEGIPGPDPLTWGWLNPELLQTLIKNPIGPIFLEG